MNKYYITVLSMLFISCSGFSKYQPPLEQDTSIEFSMGEDGNQFYYIFPKESCEESPGYGQVANMLKIYGMGGKPKKTAVIPEKSIHILGVSIVRYDYGVITKEVTCGKFAEFTPKKSQTYSISFSANQGYCHMKLKNTATEGEKNQLKDKKIPQNCAKYF